MVKTHSSLGTNQTLDVIITEGEPIGEEYEQIKNGIRFAPMALNFVNKYTGNR